MDTEILEDIGLTGAEIKVFLALLELGSCGAGKVVERSGLQNAVVHRAFHSLSEKGIVTYVYEGKTKKYQTIEPRLLLDFLEDKKTRLEKILPELEKKSKGSVEKPKAVIFQGTKGIRELFNLMLDTNGKEYIGYGGGQKSNELMGEYFWEGFHRRRFEKKIKAKLLFHESLNDWGRTLKKLNLATVRFTDKDFEELTETVICGDRVGIIIWLDKPFGFLIEEKFVVRSYKKFFEVLWKGD